MKFNKFEMLGEKAGFIVRNIETGLFLSHKETSEKLENARVFAKKIQTNQYRSASTEVIGVQVLNGEVSTAGVEEFRPFYGQPFAKKNLTLEF